MAKGIYRITLNFDGYCREYFCDGVIDSSVLLDALYKGASWDSIEVVDTRTGMIVQFIKKS